MSAVRALLRRLGKSERKVFAVFAITREACDRSVRHLREGEGDLPIWAFCLEPLGTETASLCERFFDDPVGIRLLWRAERELWPFWVALSVGDWTGRGGSWLFKLAPFFIPPFRALLLNENSDLFPGGPAEILEHVRRRMGELRRNSRHRAYDLTKGAALFLFAFFAQWFPAISRWAFAKVRGSEALEIAVPAAEGNAVLHAEFARRDWNWRQIQSSLESSNAKWVFFHHAGVTEAPDDLVSSSCPPQTFAVGRQIGHRAWRKQLFPTAPFRALQLDEMAQVLAPVSPVLLADRAKLLALGVPRVSSFGAAWFLLFWKAAAAGWPSYSRGSTSGAADLAEVAFDEAEFVKTVLAEPSLQRLAPRTPLLARGNITHCTEDRTKWRGLPRILVLSPYLPFPLSHGGAVRIFNLCRVLSAQIDFVLVCFREHGDFVDFDKLYEVFRDVYVVDADEKHSDPELPRQISEYTSSSMSALVTHLCAELSIDLLQVEYTQMAAYREAAPSVPAILVEHDLTFMLYRQFAERDASHAARREYQKWLRFEQERLKAYSAVWTMSEHDREQAVAAGSPPARTYAVPNGVDLERFSPRAKTSETPEILYVGSFRHRPNLLGFHELRERILPNVWKRFPSVRLRVVAGPDHEKHWAPPAGMDDRIVLHGFTADLLPMYAEATLVVVPLPVSAGTNIKLMEALSCQRAVVTTPVGSAGLELVDGQDAMIRDLGPDFAEAICALLASADLCERIARNGRATAEKRFGWRAIAGTAYETYGEIVPNLFS